MKRLNCGLIVSDFDGTLANSRNEVDGAVLEAIKKYVGDGGVFAVCTGRILACIMPRVKEIGLKGLVVASQGSTVADIESGELLRNSCMDGASASEICKALEELGTCANVYEAYGFYSDLPADNKYLNIYEDIVGVKAKHVDMPLSTFTKTANLKCNKVATMCAPEDRERLYEELCRRFSSRFDVTCSASVLIEISPYGETKGAALKFLAEHYGIPVEKTCAVGDNLNDLSMLEAAGYGVAVANSSKELLSKVKLVTVSNDEGAVAKVIEEYGYMND